LIYEIIRLFPPFHGDQIEEIKTKICLGRFGKLDRKKVSKKLINLVNSMIQVDSKLRPTCGN